jgi:hypothetical protein
MKKVVPALSGLRFYLLSMVFVIKINAQDTIHFRNNGIEIAKILEFGTDEIRFKRIDNLTGPTYARANRDVRFVMLQNGQIKDFTKEYPSYLNNDGERVSFEKIEIAGNQFLYKGKILKEAELTRLVKSYPDEKGKVELLKKHAEMKKAKYAQNTILYITRTVCVTAAACSAFVAAQTRESVPVFIGGSVFGVSGVLLGDHFSKIFNKKKLALKKELVNFYNSQP